MRQTGSELSPSMQRELAEIIPLISSNNIIEASRRIENIKKIPDSVHLYNQLKALLLKQQGRHEEAKLYFKFCYIQDPEAFFLPILENIALTGQLEELQAAIQTHLNTYGKAPTIQAIQKLLPLLQGSDNLLFIRAYLAESLQDLPLAIESWLETSEDYRNQPDNIQYFFRIIQNSKKLVLTDVFLKEISRFISQPEIDTTPLITSINTICESLLKKIQTSKDYGSSDSFQCLITILKLVHLQNFNDEIILTDIRCKLANNLINNTDLTEAQLDLCRAISHQLFINEYCYFVSRHEMDLINSLLLDSTRIIPKPGLSALTLLAMYMHPRDIISSGLDLSTMTSDPITSGLLATIMEEDDLLKQYAVDFEQHKRIEDTTSKTVSAMYEENPYPRWQHSVANNNYSNLRYEDFNNLCSSPHWSTNYPGEFNDLFIAGSGTGLHPVTICKNFPSLDIDAIDLSSTSLSYAKLKAKKHKIQNLSLTQQDILTIPAEGKMYDIVESIGVLHHLKKPEEGLKRLLNRLRPGGILCLGLYSKNARKAIISYREQHLCAETDHGASSIRSLRHSVLTNSTVTDNKKILSFGDFYSISGARDLLLHPQESQYTPETLCELLEAHNLKFLSFHQRTLDMLSAAPKVTIDPYDLKSWEAAEDVDSSFFAGMYQFWAQYQP